MKKVQCAVKPDRARHSALPFTESLLEYMIPGCYNQNMRKKRRKYGKRRKFIVRRALLLTAVLAVAAAAVTAWLVLRSNRLVVLAPDEIQTVLSANEYESGRQRVIAESAASLVGRVHYFWGGKSYCVGPDPEWGSPREVTSPGSSKTGTVIPYGLDCSGFVTWVYIQTGEEGVLGAIGEGTWHQWQNSTPIGWEDIGVGDLVFQNEYPGAESNHVGICIGYFRGKPVFAHCSAAEDNVVVTTAGGLFRYARRPNV